MAISFDWYENPVSPDKPEEKRFHPRIIANGQIDTKDLRSRIQSRCTLNEVDVKRQCWTHYHKLWVKNCAKEGKCTWTVSVIFIRH